MSIPAEQLEVKKNYTYGDYRKTPEGVRWEIIDGVVTVMGAPSVNHQEALGEIHLEFALNLRGKSCRAFVAPFDLCIPKDGEEDDNDVTTVLQPDLIVVCDTDKLHKYGYFGIPAMVAEIVSPSSVKSDIFRKFKLYQSLGVKEYWLVWPDEKLITVHQLGEDGLYGPPMHYAEENPIITSPQFPDLTIDLNQVLARIL